MPHTLPPRWSPSRMRLRRLAFAYLAAVSAAAALAGCVSLAQDSDSWAVRQITVAGRPRIQSLSDVNIAKPERKGVLATTRVAERQRGAATIALQADASTATALTASPSVFATELDAALHWLQRLTSRGQPTTRVVLTLIDDSWRTRVDRSHDAAKITIVELVVPVDLKNTNKRSAEVGRALAVALHETSHAVADPLLRSDRARDEYRATLVESCYLIDTLRVGDSLHFRVDDDDAPNAHFAAGESRKAARRVMADLGKAAGKPALAWSDIAALRALRRFCANRLDATAPDS